MREYNRLIKFMRGLGAAIQDYLPEAQRTSPMSLMEFFKVWTGEKSYCEVCRLKSDIGSYLLKHAANDYSVDELFFRYDISFVHERFGCEDYELLTQVLGMLDAHVEERRSKALKKISDGLVSNRRDEDYACAKGSRNVMNLVGAR